jgi:hypothetical protein
LKTQWRTLLAQDDLSTGTHVLTRLGGEFVGARLQSNDGLAGVHLFFGEFAFVFLRRAGTQPWSGPFGVGVGLWGTEKKPGHSTASTLPENTSLTTRPKAKSVHVTCEMSLASNKSTVWNTSRSGTPYFLMAFENMLMFSIILN